MNRVSIIGTGYVGLVTGACLSEFGMDVVCMDVDIEKIKNLEKGILPIYEPGLEEIISKNYKSGRLKFTYDMQEAVKRSTTIFIAVGTPPLEDGSADLQYVKEAAKNIAKYIDGYKVIVDKSTVPVGTARIVSAIIKNELDFLGKNYEFDVVSNPEFLREGAAIRDFIHPDRIIIGTESEKARKILKNIYNVLYLNDVPFIFTNFETAELIKYASNAFLATKISFINEIAILCDNVGADVHDVAKAMGLDGRIGSKFLHPGPGYGGSCFPKDTRALIKIGDESNVEMLITKAASMVNSRQRKYMISKIKKRLSCLSTKTIGVLGLAFKPETDDIRESPAIDIISELLENHTKVRAYDPIAIDNAKKYFKGKNIVFCDNEYKCAEGCDALILLTEWNQFRNLNLEQIKSLMRQPNFFDLRNVYEPENIRRIGFFYEGIGRA